MPHSSGLRWARRRIRVWPISETRQGRQPGGRKSRAMAAGNDGGLWDRPGPKHARAADEPPFHRTAVEGVGAGPYGSLGTDVGRTRHRHSVIQSVPEFWRITGRGPTQDWSHYHAAKSEAPLEGTSYAKRLGPGGGNADFPDASRRFDGRAAKLNWNQRSGRPGGLCVTPREQGRRQGSGPSS